MRGSDDIKPCFAQSEKDSLSIGLVCAFDKFTFINKSGGTGLSWSGTGPRLEGQAFGICVQSVSDYETGGTWRLMPLGDDLRGFLAANAGIGKRDSVWVSTYDLSPVTAMEVCQHFGCKPEKWSGETACAKAAQQAALKAFGEQMGISGLQGPAVDELTLWKVARLAQQMGEALGRRREILAGEPDREAKEAERNALRSLGLGELEKGAEAPARRQRQRRNTEERQR